MAREWAGKQYRPLLKARPVMDDLPEARARLIFAVLLFRDRALSRTGFEYELTKAFGSTVGRAIAETFAESPGFIAASTPEQL